jgi:hypothetical protein
MADIDLAAVYRYGIGIPGGGIVPVAVPYAVYFCRVNIIKVTLGCPIDFVAGFYLDFIMGKAVMCG